MRRLMEEWARPLDRPLLNRFAEDVRFRIFMPERLAARLVDAGLRRIEHVEREP